MKRSTNENGGRAATNSPPTLHTQATMENAIQRYLAERERSSSTIRIVRQLAPWWGRFRLGEVNDKLMREYAKTLAHLSQATKARLCRQARTVYLFGCKEYDIAAKQMSVPSEGQHRTEFLGRDELTLLLANLRPDARAICTFMALTGARYCEARLVEVDDLKVAGDVTLCRLRHQKGKEALWRERTVPLHPEVLAVIQSHGSASGALWRNSRGERWHKDAGSLRQHMQAVAKELGLTARPHILRHTFGTLLAKGGGDIRTVAGLLGHASLGQTQTYINLGNIEAAGLVGRL